MSPRSTALAIAVVLVLSSCSGDVDTDSVEATTTQPTTTTTTTQPTTTTTTTTLPTTTTTTLSAEEIAAAQYEDDARLIRTLFRRLSDAFFGGTEEALRYMVEHTYPALGCTVEAALAWYDDVADGYREEHIIDAATIERDDGWTMPDGPSRGEPIDGRIYIFVDDVTFSAPGFESSSERAEVHATILDDSAYFFFGCWPEESS